MQILVKIPISTRWQIRNVITLWKLIKWLYPLNWITRYQTRVTCNSSSILDQVLGSFSDRVFRRSVIFVGIPGHQLAYFQKKVVKIKSYCHLQIIFRSLKNYLPGVYEGPLSKLSFPNYELFDNSDKAYKNFIPKVMTVIDNYLTHSNNKRIKSTSQDSFDAEITKKRNERDTICKKLKNSGLYLNEGNYKEA